MIETVCDKDFEQKVIGAVGPVVVDMYGINCISCRKVDAVVERLAPKYDGKCKFYRLNVEESPRTASRYHVMSLPTLLFFKAGEISKAAVGAVLDAILISGIEELL